MSDHLSLTEGALQEVAHTPVENDQFKRYTRRRKQLVLERVCVVNRLQSDLHAVCLGLLAIAGKSDNIWFLNSLTCRDKLTKLAGLRRSGLLSIHGVCKTYAAQIQAWQVRAQFAPDVEWVGEIILQDARRMLALGEYIKAMDQKIAAVAARSELAQTIGSIPGFGKTLMAEIAGEVGTLERFKSEAGLAVYMGMAVLDASAEIVVQAAAQAAQAAQAEAAEAAVAVAAAAVKAAREHTTGTLNTTGNGSIGGSTGTFCGGEASSPPQPKEEDAAVSSDTEKEKADKEREAAKKEEKSKEKQKAKPEKC